MLMSILRLRATGLSLLMSALAAGGSAHDGPEPVRGPQPPRAFATATQLTQDGPERADANETCNVRVHLTSQRTGQSSSGLVRAFTASGQSIALPGLLSRASGLSPDSMGDAAFSHVARWSIAAGAFEFQAPRGPVTIEAFRGVATELTSVTIDLTHEADYALRVPLREIDSPYGVDWTTGNVHVHLRDMTRDQAERYASEAAAADGLDVVFFSYLERPGPDASYISNEFRAEDMERLSARAGLLFGLGEEYRHNFSRGGEGYGHVMLLEIGSLILPASIGPGITRAGNDDLALRPGIERARTQGATTLWCHNQLGFEDIPSWVAGLLDAQTIFDQGNKGSYEGSFYRYLNIGLRVPFATGTDWFFRDMAMTYVDAPRPITLEGWLEALRGGRSFITNGPLLGLTAEDKGPGETVELAAPGRVAVRARAVGRRDFRRIELIRNGELIASAPSAPGAGGYVADILREVQIDESAWFALRTPPPPTDYNRPSSPPLAFNEYGKPLFSHTSAVHVRVGGRDVFIPAAAESLLAEVEGDRGSIRERGEFSGEEALGKVLAIYDEAIDRLREKLGEADAARASASFETRRGSGGR